MAGGVERTGKETSSLVGFDTGYVEFQNSEERPIVVERVGGNPKQEIWTLTGQSFLEISDIAKAAVGLVENRGRIEHALLGSGKYGGAGVAGVIFIVEVSRESQNQT